MRQLMTDAGIDLDALAKQQHWNIDDVDAFVDGEGAARLIKFLGASVKLSKAQVDVSVMNAHIDTLLTNERWRLSAGLVAYPVTKAMLREVIVSRLGAGQSYQDVADWLMANWIPTPTGLREWRRTNIGTYTKNLPNEPYPVPAPECLIWPMFRDWAAAAAVGRVALHQPSLVLKSALRYAVSDRAVTFRSDDTIRGIAVWIDTTITRFLLDNQASLRLGTDELKAGDRAAG